MATTPELPEWTGGKLANGEFLGYSKAIYGVLCNLDKTALPIGEPLAQLEAANLRLTDFINESQRYGDTSEIAAADATRDYLFKAIYDGVEQLSRIEGEIGMTLATQAKKLFNVLVAYKGAYKHSLTKETEELQGLEFDLQKKPEAAEAVTMLGLQSWFEALSSANQRVDYLYSHRTGERSDREAAKGGDSTDSLRKTAAGLIATIIRRINVFNEVSPSEASAAAANGVAGVIKQYKLVISSHAGKKEEPEPEPNTESAAQG